VAYFFRATLYSLMCAFAINDDGADALFFAPPPALKILDPPLSTPSLIGKRAPYWSNVNLKRRRSRNCSTHRTSLRLNKFKTTSKSMCVISNRWKLCSRNNAEQNSDAHAISRVNAVRLLLNTSLHPLVSNSLFVFRFTVYCLPLPCRTTANKVYLLNSHNWIARQLSKRASKFENRLVETTASADLYWYCWNYCWRCELVSITELSSS